MPYIDKELREPIAQGKKEPETLGQLNFAITHDVMTHIGKKPISYDAISAVIAAFECALKGDPSDGLANKITERVFNFQNTTRGYYTEHEVLATVKCAQLEFYRRVAAPYEDAKCMENGDVYRAFTAS